MSFKQATGSKSASASLLLASSSPHSLFNSWLTLPVQPIDATPSGIKLVSKVVFMIQGKRFGLSAAQKSDMWRRWKAGQSLHEIERAFGKPHTSIRCLVLRYGGIIPAVRRSS